MQNSNRRCRDKVPEQSAVDEVVYCMDRWVGRWMRYVDVNVGATERKNAIANDEGWA